jgi:hypothetical protein
MVDKRFKNIAILTLEVQDVQQKQSKAGRPYALAMGYLPMFQGDPLPLRIVACDDLTTEIQPGTWTLTGRLGYQEREEERTILLFPTKVEPVPQEGRGRNFAMLTLRAQEPDCRVSEKSGNFWTRVRMFLSQGKDPAGTYKPALWLTVKGFTRKDGDDGIPNALGRLNKGDLVTVSGCLTYEVYEGKTYVGLRAFKVESLPRKPTIDQTVALEGEPEIS